jgi:protein involved in polysaccharide export with SLBB domain
MKNLFCWGGLLACSLLTGCASSGSHMAASSPSAATEAPPPVDVIRVGDKITVRLSGVPDDGFFNEIQVPASGDITLPLLTGAFHAAGQTTADLAAQISAAYKGGKIYTNPVVTVIEEERYVNVGGDVRSPSRVAYSPDSTLMSTINSCGGFTEYANRRAVRIIRGQQTLQIDCVQAAQVPGADPRVYPGDEIYVPRTMF